MYRFVSPYQEEMAVLMYNSEYKSKSILFSYSLHSTEFNQFSPISLMGLNPKLNYRIEEISKMPNNSYLKSAVIEITEL